MTSTLLALLLLCAAPRAQVPDAAQVGLPEARDLAERHSPALRAAEGRLDAAEARAGAAFGRLLPRAELSASYARWSYVEPAVIEIPVEMEGVAIGPITLGEAVQDRGSTRVAFEQPLLGGGALAAWRASQDNRAALAFGRDVARQDVRLEASEAWLDLAAARAAAAVTVQAEGAVRAHRERLDRLAASGKATGMEVAEAEALLAEARQRRVEVEGLAEAARMRLASLLGYPLDTPIALEESPASPASPAPSAPSTAPELAAARAAAQAADRQARAVAAGIWPRLSLRAGYQYENPNTRYFPATAEWNSSWDASLALSWGLDSGVRWHEARAARAEVATAEAGAVATAEALERADAQALLAIRTAEGALEAATARREAAQAARLAAVERFEAGVLTSSDLLNRETALAEAALGVVSARIGLLRAEARLTRIRGGL